MPSSAGWQEENQQTLSFEQRVLQSIQELHDKQDFYSNQMERWMEDVLQELRQVKLSTQNTTNYTVLDKPPPISSKDEFDSAEKQLATMNAQAYDTLVIFFHKHWFV